MNTVEPDNIYGGPGVDRSQGYFPMDLPPTESTPAPEPEPVADDRDTPLSPEEAARFLGESRRNRAAAGEEEAPPVERPPAQKPIIREYVRQSGRDAGKTMPSNETVDLPRAASDLGDLRAEERAAEQAALNAELAQAFDQARTGDTQQPEQQPYQQEQQPVDPNADVIEVLQKNPKLMAALQAEYAQYEAQVEQAKAVYISGLQQNAQVALAAALAEFPEARSITDVSQIETVIRTVAVHDPQRAQRMVARVQQITQLAEQAQTAQRLHEERQAAQQWAQHQDRWNTFAQEEDAKFTQKYPDLPSEVQRGAQQYLRDIGFSDDDLAKSWNGEYSWSPRDARVQQVIYEASLYRRAQQGVRQKTFQQIPVVQRPGSGAVERGSDADYRFAQLNAKLSETASPKDAAQLLVARRAARRGR